MSRRFSNATSRLTAWWDRYWFTPASLRNLAICRMILFAVMLWDLYRFRVLVRPLGTAPASFFKPILIIQFLHLGPPTLLILDIVFYSLIVSGIGAIIGFRTKTCIFIYLMLYVYWVSESFSFGVVHHGNAPFVFFTTVLLFSPSAAALSLDDLRARIKTALKRGSFKEESSESRLSEYAGWPLRFMQVLMSLIYFLSGYAKLQLNHGLEWVNGSTLQYYLISHNNYYGSLLAQNFFLCRVLSFFTLGFELGFPLILIIPQLAWIMLPMGVAFHIGTLYTMDTFFYQFFTCYIAFINFDRLGVWFRTKLRIPFNSRDLKVIFDGGCPLCLRSVTIVSYFDWFKRVDFIDLSDWAHVSSQYPYLDKEKCLEQMHVIDREKKVYGGFFAFRRIAWAILLLWIFLPVFYLPIVPAIGQRIYLWVARHRARAGAACTLDTCK